MSISSMADGGAGSKASAIFNKVASGVNAMFQEQAQQFQGGVVIDTLNPLI